MQEHQPKEGSEICILKIITIAGIIKYTASICQVIILLTFKKKKCIPVFRTFFELREYRQERPSGRKIRHMRNRQEYLYNCY